MDGSVKITGIGLLFIGIRFLSPTEMGICLYPRKETGPHRAVDRAKRNLIFILFVPSSGNDFRRPEQEQFLQYERKCSWILDQVVLTVTALSSIFVAIVGIPVMISICLLAPVPLDLSTESGRTASQ